VTAAQRTGIATAVTLFYRPLFVALLSTPFHRAGAAKKNGVAAQKTYRQDKAKT
jgi:hypothetical protein